MRKTVGCFGIPKPNGEFVCNVMLFMKLAREQPCRSTTGCRARCCCSMRGHHAHVVAAQQPDHCTACASGRTAVSDAGMRTADSSYAAAVGESSPVAGPAAVSAGRPAAAMTRASSPSTRVAGDETSHRLSRMPDSRPSASSAAGASPADQRARARITRILPTCKCITCRCLQPMKLKCEGCPAYKDP